MSSSKKHSSKHRPGLSQERTPSHTPPQGKSSGSRLGRFFRGLAPSGSTRAIEHESPSSSPSTKAHGQPTFGPEGVLPLGDQLRWLTIHWATHESSSPKQVAQWMRYYAMLLEGIPSQMIQTSSATANSAQTWRHAEAQGHERTLFRSVIDQMIEERQKQGDSHE